MGGVFKECDLDARMEGEIHPKALTFPVDTVGEIMSRCPLTFILL